jgi:phosphatidylglycerol:prolipoprotein diacylglycerol transferase
VSDRPLPNPMTFPVYLNLFGLRLHPHPVLEVLAYAGGFQLYLLLRRRGMFPQAKVPLEQNAWVIVGCIFGALVGSKLLAFAESFHHYWAMRDNPFAMLGGKTIAGGLIGGWAGVEIAKRAVGITHSTGDAFAFPLILGMCVGRVGCFLTGLADHTYGLHTGVPWAVDFGDGPRHPTQLYEIAFLLLLGAALFVRMRTPHPNGQLFRLFLLGYLVWRCAIEFLKPRDLLVGPLSAIQLASFAGATVCAYSLFRRPDRRDALAATTPANVTTQA